MPQPILQFQNVTVAGGHPYDSALWNIDFSLNEGDMMLLKLGSGQSRLPLADAAQGLVTPDEGSIQFRGQAWGVRSRAQADAARGEIGRVFDEPQWISSLSVEENITLARRHHSTQTDDAIREEAAALARLFSLPGLPLGRAATVRRPDLRRAACVRAFLGKPRLVILEEPTADVYPQMMPALMSCIRSARAQGAAILWTTGDTGVWNDAGIRATLRCAMSGPQMRAITGGN